MENENDDSSKELSRGLIIAIAAAALIVVCCFFGCYKLLNVLDGEERAMIVKDLTTVTSASQWRRFAFFD